jgi:NAD(P)-dependent dehydrogenase (short-subunit alcohol dehydrogenase family)
LTKLTGRTEAGGGSIVFLSSVLSIRGTPGAVPYAAGKGALDAETVLFLSTPVSAYLTGPLIDVDGGWSATAPSVRTAE